MSPVQPYYGPIGMADSRYASPQRRKQVEALLAAKPELQARKNAENILATREQATAAAAGVLVRTPGDGVQLAQAQGRAFEQQIAHHKHVLNQMVSNVVAKTRHILALISEAIKHERPDTAVASLKVVESLRQEMEKLVTSTRVHQAHQDIQEELDQKNKKIKLGQELVYGQQQAYKNVETDASNEIAELQERLSRLHMELGSVQTELDTVNVQLQKAKTAEENAAKIRDVLEAKVVMLNDSKESLSAENESIRGDIKDLEAKLKALEDKARDATENYEKQLLNLKDQLQKEQQKAASLDSHLKALRQADETSRREVDKVKAESKLLFEKYTNQSGAYAKKSEDLKEQTKKADTLDGEVRALQQQKIELEKEHNRVNFLKDSLQKQHDAVKSELTDLKQKSVLAKEEAQQLSAKLKRAESENDDLETENNDLRAKQLEHNKTVVAVKKGDAEIATLRATVQSFQNKPAATNDSVDVAALKQELQGMKERFTQSEANRAEWEELLLESHAPVPRDAA